MFNSKLFQAHWLSIGPVTLYSAIGMVVLLTVAGLIKGIFEMHQLRAPYMQCQIGMVGFLKMFSQLLKGKVLASRFNWPDASSWVFASYLMDASCLFCSYIFGCC